MFRVPACFVIAIALLPRPAAHAAEAQGDPEVTVLVYNDAQIPDAVLTLAEEQATRIFHQTGIRTQWMDCFAMKVQLGLHCTAIRGPRVFMLRIVPKTSRFNEIVFGAAYLASDTGGKYADVFYDRVERMHSEWRASLASLLGCVAAHEIGHLLLGSNSHAPLGIMRAHWQAKEIQQMSMGLLVFSPRQAAQMRAGLEAADALRLNVPGK